MGGGAVAWEFKHLYTFKVLTEELNFTRTAQRLNYAQSSVTTQIQELESEFRSLLFERLGKRIRLTAAGERLLQYTDEILRLATEASVVVPDNKEPSGTLTIGAVESLCTYRLAPVLSEFRSRHPQVELIFRTGICADLRQEVLRGHLDLAFTLEEAGRDDLLVFEVLLSETMLVLAHPTSRLVGRDQIAAPDLDGETILVTEMGCSYRNLFERELTLAGLNNMKIEFASIEAIKQCVMAGLGITMLPKMAVSREIDAGELVSLPWTGSEFAIVTQMCWHKDKWMSPALQAFIDVSREMIGTARLLQ